MNKTYFGTFRGWCVEYNRLVYGAMLSGRAKGEIEVFIFEHHDDVVDYNDNPPKYNNGLLDNIVQVNPKSLAMFTGAYDKEGKPIYGSIPLPNGSMSKGGDVVNAKMCYGPGGFHPRTIEICYHLELGFQFNYFDKKNIKIIGNAYENPELLEV